MAEETSAPQERNADTAENSVSHYDVGSSPANAPVAEEYGTYFNHPDTRRLAFGVMILSLCGVVLVIARNVYRFLILQPVEDIGEENSTDVEDGDNPGEEASSIVNFVIFLLFVKYSVLWILWSYNKEGSLDSLLFLFCAQVGIYGVVSVILVLVGPERYTPEFENCERNDPCFNNYLFMEILWGFVYLVAASYANKLIRTIYRVENKYQEPKEIPDALIIRVLENVNEAEQLTPLANDAGPRPN
eukprot:CAMPEP_0184054154 /NCGR_PEP_ID=MMETSP0956-20121227/6409_1 /TAXON_ID=627963 /ORGANISM="Aplanochytrium sp, Strain PBS07" /LENGTH=244 /DNA_ID=CAMNT_0026347727 /DNA_START=31 /DNA_END=764 /DNA_ORIENTATION=-